GGQVAVRDHPGSRIRDSRLRRSDHGDEAGDYSESEESGGHRIMRNRFWIAAAAALALAWPNASRADAVSDFYKGKTVIIYVGVAAGGLYSTFATLLSRHIGKHLPGNPTFVVEHQVGAGGIVAANNVYNVLPKDGTIVFTPLSQTAKRVVL